MPKRSEPSAESVRGPPTTNCVEVNEGEGDNREGEGATALVCSTDEFREGQMPNVRMSARPNQAAKTAAIKETRRKTDFCLEFMRRRVTARNHHWFSSHQSDLCSAVSVRR